MKVVILAGGAGTRLAEETEVRPKPMVEIGSRPILWHIMKYYAHYGFNDFLVALGYKGEVIKRYFVEYHLLNRNLKIDLGQGEVIPGQAGQEDWRVELVDTGILTGTGGRLKRLAPLLENQRFMLTWGDGLSNVDLPALIRFHRAHGKLATITAVRPPARYGYMTFDGPRVLDFEEKPQLGEGWINGAFFVLEPEVLDYIAGDETYWEQEPLEALAREGQLMAWKHEGFWQCMDTLREKYLLEQLWQHEHCPWRTWE